MTLVSQHDGRQGRVSLRPRLFQGDFEDSVSETLHESKDLRSDSRGSSLLEDVIFHWMHKQTQAFNINDPSLISLSYYPLRIIAAEWMTYMDYISLITNKYERIPNDFRPLTNQLAILYADLSSLQQWNRRSLATTRKLRYVISFLNQRGSMDEDRESCAQLIEDYEHIASLNHLYSLRLDGIVSVVTSLIQIIDSKRSLLETTNLSRLTYLALVFVPLTFVSSLFSMNGNLASAAQTFWIYFAVAIPICVIVFLIARPPKKILAWLHHGFVSNQRSSEVTRARPFDRSSA